uniref:Uncharacterized protein n=1 Tax=Rhizophagus irregularis (strain DAOM 181602 / DAOM 197198 / MUCL 43194) TaxID=747089 RepID=U9STL7_RHIID
MIKTTLIQVICLFFEYANNGILRDYFSELDWNIKLRFTIHTSKNIIRRNLFI